MTRNKKNVTPIQDTEEPEIDGAALADDMAYLIERPDGFYWHDKSAGRMYGPFPTMHEAREDMQYQEDSDYEEGESLREAEAEIGISDWIDPETGGPSESLAPHLSDE